MKVNEIKEKIRAEYDVSKDPKVFAATMTAKEKDAFKSEKIADLLKGTVSDFDREVLGYITDEKVTLKSEKETMIAFLSEFDETEEIKEMINSLSVSVASESSKIKISDFFVSVLTTKGLDTSHNTTSIPEKATVKNRECFSVVRDAIVQFNKIPEDERHGKGFKDITSENYQLYWNTELLLKLAGHTILVEDGVLKAVKTE